MPSIVSVSTYQPPYTLTQDLTSEFAKELFEEDFQDITRLLTVFQNGQIDKRNFSVPIEWFEQEHGLADRNDLYVKNATQYGVEVIKKCLSNPTFLKKDIPYEDVDAIFFISSTGLSTPSIEARIMNELPFTEDTKRVPIWGLGCAGGAAGISRAYEFCRAYPEAKALVVCVELCSLTFQRNDRTKSNVIGTSLFADGVACALLVGDEVDVREWSMLETHPFIQSTGSYLMPNSEDVMGWDVKDNGLYVVFSRDIPNIIKEWLKPTTEKFLQQANVKLTQINEFIFHPGGKKVLDAYEAALGIPKTLTERSRGVLKENGNMSSPTVLYVLHECMQEQKQKGEIGLMGALGPGFSAELLQLEWK